MQRVLIRIPPSNGDRTDRKGGKRSIPGGTGEKNGRRSHEDATDPVHPGSAQRRPQNQADASVTNARHGRAMRIEPASETAATTPRMTTTPADRTSRATPPNPATRDHNYCNPGTAGSRHPNSRSRRTEPGGRGRPGRRGHPNDPAGRGTRTTARRNRASSRSACEPPAEELTDDDTVRAADDEQRQQPDPQDAPRKPLAGDHGRGRVRRDGGREPMVEPDESYGSRRAPPRGR